MTVSENNSPKVIVSSATGYAVGETIDFTFPYTEKEDVKLKIGDEVKEYNTDYELITTAPDVLPQKVTLKVAVGANVKVTIYRETPIDQQSEYPQDSKFRSEQVESDFDKVCMVQQEKKELMDRCLKVPIEVTDPDHPERSFNAQIPAPIANKGLCISADGKSIGYTDYDPDWAYDQTLAFRNQAGSYANAAGTSATLASSYKNSAYGYMTTASAKATEATKQASIATAKTGEVQTIYEGATLTISQTRSEALTTIAGARSEALNTISTAKTAATVLITQTKNTAVNSVNAAAAAGTGAIVQERDTAHNLLLQDIAAAKDYAEKAIGWDITYEPDATEDTLVFVDRTPEEIETAINYVVDAKNTAITEIQGVTSGIQTSINNATTSAVNSVNQAKTSATQAIASTESGVLSAIESAKQTAVQTVNSTATSALASIDNEANEGRGQVAAERDLSITAVYETRNNVIIEINNTVQQSKTELTSMINAATASIEQSRQICEEMAQRATLGWNIEFQDDSIVFTAVEPEEE